MADRADIQRRIAGWFLQSLGLEIPTPETDLFETGVLDSLAFVELLLQLERDFGVKIALDEVEIDHFKSVERIATFLLNGGTAAPLAEGGVGTYYKKAGAPAQ
jgi:methoxymalonate biosynthesis acyl carrier protein